MSDPTTPPSPPSTSPASPAKRPWTILGRLSKAVREQNWFAVALELVIAVVGIQLGNWNAERIEAQRREQIVDALETTLRDAIGVQERFAAEIEAMYATKAG